MPVPRFHIRTLMITVGVMAVAFWVLGLTLLAGLLFGPALGAFLLACHPRYQQDDFDRPLGIFGGAIAGGLAQGGLLFGIVEFNAGGLLPPGPVSIPWPSVLLELLFANFVIGVAVGIVFALFDLCRATVSGPRIAATRGHSDVPAAAAESLLAEFLANDRTDVCSSPE